MCCNYYKLIKICIKNKKLTLLTWPNFLYKIKIKYARVLLGVVALGGEFETEIKRTP